jgi:hypothetical protein
MIMSCEQMLEDVTGTADIEHAKKEQEEKDKERREREQKDRERKSK